MKRPWIKFFYVIFFIIIIYLLTSNVFSKIYAHDNNKLLAEKIINQYIQENNLNIKPNTPEYSIFLKDILWGAYPELNEHPYNDIIKEYAANYINKR
ncbi:MAG: hypothetical protein IMX03_08050 [Brockia lithotrophica]|nr:hypothetical protein [Brockia lithotrophica]